MEKEINDFQTPTPVCEYMVSLLSKSVHSVLEPTPGEGNIVSSLRSRNYDVTAPNDFWGIDEFFDAIVMNPPFTPMEMGYKILYRCMGMTNEIIALMPWLSIINSEKRTQDILNYGLKSITHLPRSIFRGSRVQTCILQMKKNYSNDIRLVFYEITATKSKYDIIS